MTQLSRRRFTSAITAVGLAGLIPSQLVAKTSSAKLVVIGGGFGGATAARFAKRLLPSLSVTLVEPNPEYVACPFSNLVVAGVRDLQQQRFTYAALSREGITVAQDTAVEVDNEQRTVQLAGGASLSYDRLILAPGIDFRWNALEGYDEAATTRMPHAWKAGPQTMLLRDQLRAIDNGGVVALSVTAAPYRCPPGPYERASLIASYLSQHKPRSKIIILDSNERFSKQPLFLDAWQDKYPGMVEWRAASNDGRVTRVDSSSMRIQTDFEDINADVINIVPPQQAGFIAQRAGTTDGSGWCPINATSFESLLQRNIHVIGDATIAAPMPKSAFSANAQGKVCAIAIVRLLNQLEVEATTLANTCYSYVTPSEAISVAGVYNSGAGTFTNVPNAGGISPAQDSNQLRKNEARQASDWFQAITSETFL
ncbi:MAG: FCSD flavin-binding domain-containing protein [Halioglobus sp.]